MKLLFILVLYLSNLFALTPLESNYYTKTKEITLGDIIQSKNKKVVLYTMSFGKTTKRVKSKKLLKLLAKYGYKNYTSPHAYTQFSIKSPIDTHTIKKHLQEYYKNHYKQIEILITSVHSRSYLAKLPLSYEVKIKSKNYLKSEGVLSIVSPEHKSYFFDYKIKAQIPLYVAKKNIKRKQELSFKNSVKKSIILNKFYALPIQSLKATALQSKHKILKGSVITIRDVSKLTLVKRGENISVSLKSNNMYISFSAKAEQSGSLGETINVTHKDGRKIAVIITGKNQAKVKQ